MNHDHRPRKPAHGKGLGPKSRPAPAQPGIAELLLGFEGIEEAALEAAEPDREAGGILPAAISIGVTPDALGLHMLEFLAWAVGDMEEAGAAVHLHLEAPPPWENEPGRSLVASILVSARNEEASEKEALEEIRVEITEMTAFLRDMYESYWPMCRPGG